MEAIKKVTSTDERLAKAGAEFKRLEAKIDALSEEVKFLHEHYAKKYTTMKDVWEWYFKRLQEETDELTTNKKA